jgi:O-acetyl-ADP-ribose deacetylase (regulator of RNase III)
VESGLELAVTWPILVVAFVCLLGGIGLYLWAVRRPRARYVNSTNVIAWLLIGLFPTLIIFSFFPDSNAEGELVGIGLSGAIAAFAAIFVVGHRAGGAAIARDQDFEALRAENDLLRSQSAESAQRDGDRKRLIGEQRELRFRVAGRRGAELEILTGELTDVKGFDVWVSSENTNMQPARYYDRSVSSLVRYLGASKTEGGHPVDDVIADELAECMQAIGTLTVEPATVIATGSGALHDTHGVRRIYHVAAVQGQVGVGYRPVGNISECVTNALAKLDADKEQAHDCRTIMFPLLGTGTAAGDPEIVKQLISAATQYMRRHPASRVKTVAFLARHHEDLRLCATAAASCDGLKEPRGSAEALLEA